jgi:hypothetical protein
MPRLKCVSAFGSIKVQIAIFRLTNCLIYDSPRSRKGGSRLKLVRFGHSTMSNVSPLSPKPVICPDGQINATGVGSSVQPFLQKYSDFQKSKISLYPWLSRLTRGALRGRHGRWVRDAVDADSAFDEWRDSGRRSRVVLTPRRWCQACEGNSAGDGDNKARSPGRARRKPLKPLRGECRAFPV